MFDNKIEDDEKVKYYNPSIGYDAKIFISNGKFVLAEGSEVNRPPKKAKNWKSENHYNRFNKIIYDYIER